MTGSIVFVCIRGRRSNFYRTSKHHYWRANEEDVRAEACEARQHLSWSTVASMRAITVSIPIQLLAIVGLSLALGEGVEERVQHASELEILTIPEQTRFRCSERVRSPGEARAGAQGRTMIFRIGDGEPADREIEFSTNALGKAVRLVDLEFFRSAGAADVMATSAVRFTGESAIGLLLTHEVERGTPMPTSQRQQRVLTGVELDRARKLAQWLETIGCGREVSPPG